MAKKQTQVNPAKQELYRFVVGMIMILIALFFLVSISFFFVDGGADRSIFDMTFWELLINTDLDVRNPMGKFGAWFADMMVTNGVGVMAFGLPVLVVFFALRVMGVREAKEKKLFPFISRFFIVTVWGSITLGYVLSRTADDTYLLAGGMHGYYVAKWLMSSIGVWGTGLLLFGSLIIYLGVKVENFRYNILKCIEWLSKGHIKLPTLHIDNTDGQSYADEAVAVAEPAVSDKPAEEAVMAEPVEPQSDDEEDEEPTAPTEVQTEPVVVVPEPTAAQAEEDEDTDFVINEGTNDETVIDTNRGGIDTPYDPTLDLEHYQYPTFDLLEDYEQKNGDETPEKIEERRQELERNKNKIIETLDQFKIGVQKIEATIGPTVTLYEIVPVPGVKISRIQSLENDIAMSLAALCVRIIAPIPGKGTIGIEVPNSKPKIVSMLSVLKSSAYQNSKYELPVVLGKTISNETFVFDLAKAPHLLVAGATGQGKSVGLNALLTSLLYKKHPSQVKLVLIDPKMVEFSMYSKLEKHFLAKRPSESEPIITDSENAKAVLNSLVQEMEDRYKLIKGIARNIKEYNEKFIRRELNPENGHKFLPYIVVIIDEYGDLVMVAGKEVADPITRIAQKARAVGIHMVLATQRPSTDVVTGIIKANFPSRIAFKVTNMVDSRTVLDASGAQHLIGRGDMLASIAGGTTTRVQCALVETDEVIRINDFISKQVGYACAFELPDGLEGEGGAAGGSGEPLAPGDFDPLIAEAARKVVECGQGSTSNIQRGMSLGFNRAGRIMDQLERMGIVGPQEKAGKPRDVFVHTADELDNILRNFGIK